MRTSFKAHLAEKLGDSIEKDLKEYLPNGYQQIGHVIILYLSERIVHKKMVIAEAVKKIVKNCETICLKKGEISGQFREPQIEVLIGDKTETVVMENNIKYKFDVLKIMFAKGNINERKRYINLVNKGEIIFDFFAGIGYFSLGLAKFSQASKIYAFEINPASYHYLVENIELNKIPREKLIPILGDCNIKALEINEQADRVLMGILPSPKASLVTAFKKINSAFATIHYEGLLADTDTPEVLLTDVDRVAKKFNRRIELLHIEKIKSYRPHVYHVCLDIGIK